MSAGNHPLDDLFGDVVAEGLVRDERAVLSGDDDRVDPDGTAVVVFDRDLRLAIGTEIIEQAVTPRARESLDQLVRQHNRQRHELVGLGAGVPEHQALIAGASWIDALGDVGRLLVNRGQNGARLVVEPVFRPGVADILDRIADDLLVVDAGRSW